MAEVAETDQTAELIQSELPLEFVIVMELCRLKGCLNQLSGPAQSCPAQFGQQTTGLCWNHDHGNPTIQKRPTQELNFL